MNGGLEHIAQMRAIALGADVELQLEKAARPGYRPILAMLADARKRAAAAMVNLCLVDADDAKTIRALQNELILFDDMVRSVKKIVESGREADRLVTEEDRAVFEQMIADSAEFSGETEVNDR